MDIGPTVVVVTVALRRRALVCPGLQVPDPRPLRHPPARVAWRHLDLGVFKLEVRARLRRLACPEHGIVSEQVPFARA